MLGVLILSKFGIEVVLGEFLIKVNAGIATV
jgi:hypothetical protein